MRELKTADSLRERFPMKELILVRHAKSSWKDPALRDHERPLNKRGKRDAPEMGERLARRGCRPDLFISSSAVRALETARTFAVKLGYPPEDIQTEERIYHASVGELLEAIRCVEASVVNLMLFGHNPGLTELANRLGSREIHNLSTCALLHLRFDIDAWSGLAEASGEELAYDFPKKKPT